MIQFRSVATFLVISTLALILAATGLAQVSGCRGETAEVEEMRARIEYDLEYLRRWTPMLDLKILWRTGLVLFLDRKAY